MCCCEKPTRNDEQRGWNSEAFAPALAEDDVLIYDECGRCKPQIDGTGSVDYHSYHFRLVNSFDLICLLVRHGGGDKRIEIGYSYMRIAELLEPMDSDRRYMMMHAFYSVYMDTERRARETETARWEQAAADKRIKTRRLTAQGRVKVWIEPLPTSQVAGQGI